MCEVEQNFLTDNERHLIRRAFEALSVRTDEIVLVNQLGRYGKSGARLLLCLLRRDKTAFVVKIHRARKITDEFQAIRSVKDYFPELDSVAEPPCAHRQGALLYRHLGARFKKRLRSYTELWKVAYDLSKSETEITATFKEMWKCFQHARDGISIGAVTFSNQYKYYTRSDDFEPVLEAVFGNDRETKDFRFLDADITNPLGFIKDSGFKRLRRVKKGPVHGDLHANNVVIDNFGNVHLIDFAWAERSKHVLVDYVLMECSLRFLLFPKPTNANYVNPSEQLIADQWLLEEDGGERLQRDKWIGSRLGPYYRRLGTMVSAIRSEARDFMVSDGNGGFHEYLAAQFLVLFGQMSYPDYNRLMVARALGLIAHKLREEGFGS